MKKKGHAIWGQKLEKGAHDMLVTRHVGPSVTFSEYSVKDEWYTVLME